MGDVFSVETIRNIRRQLIDMKVRPVVDRDGEACWFWIVPGGNVRGIYRNGRVYTRFFPWMFKARKRPRPMAFAKGMTTRQRRDCK